MFDRCLIFFIFSVITGIAALVVIPKKSYRKYLLYSVFLGGNGDAVLTPLFSHLLHLIRYKNMGYFNVLNTFAFWTPVTWMFAFSIFFYLLPTKKITLVLYLLTWTGLSYSVGLVLHQLGLFDYIGIGRYISPIIFFIWFTIAAWVFIKYENIALK